MDDYSVSLNPNFDVCLFEHYFCVVRPDYVFVYDRDGTYSTFFPIVIPIPGTFRNNTQYNDFNIIGHYLTYFQQIRTQFNVPAGSEHVVLDLLAHKNFCEKRVNLPILDDMADEGGDQFGHRRNSHQFLVENDEKTQIYLFGVEEEISGGGTFFSVCPIDIITLEVKKRIYLRLESYGVTLQQVKIRKNYLFVFSGGRLTKVNLDTNEVEIGHVDEPYKIHFSSNHLICVFLNAFKVYVLEDLTLLHHGQHISLFDLTPFGDQYLLTTYARKCVILDKRFHEVSSFEHSPYGIATSSEDVMVVFDDMVKTVHVFERPLRVYFDSKLLTKAGNVSFTFE
jgi:hypothetical protein